MSNIKWYRLDNILKYKAQYYIAIGERSNGKTYATLEHFINRYFEHGEQFGYIKRYDEDIKSKYMKEVFNHLEHLFEKRGKKVKFFQGQFLVYDKDSDGKLKDCETMGYAFSLSNSNRFKGTSYPKINNIVFEEFMSMDCTYLPDEINLLLNLVSTIARNRTNVKVFMLANTISKYNPYFSALKLKAHRIEKGKILYKVFTDSKGFKTAFAIERTENVNVFDNEENINKTVYNIFGDSGVGSMITTGDFEVHSYKTKVDNYCFEGVDKGTIISKKYKTSLVIRFEDYFYRIYLIDDHVKFISAFREIDEKSIKESNTTHILNGAATKKGIVNINNIQTFNGYEYNELFDIIISTIKQKDFIVMSDDDGENVVNGFRLCGVSYTHI